jgi:UTP--glucose-1-phosphate uridylyltransferase
VNTLDHITAALTKAEAGGVHGAELAALRRRLQQLGEQQAGLWRWYNTNNIWVDLRALKDLQAADPAAPDLPLIVNRKTVDRVTRRVPRCSSSSRRWARRSARCSGRGGTRRMKSDSGRSGHSGPDAIGRRMS